MKVAIRERAFELLVILTPIQVQIFCYEGLPANRVRVFFTKEANLPKSLQSFEKEYSASVSSALYKLLRDCEAQLHKSNVSHIRIHHVTFFYSPPLATVALERIFVRSEKRATLTERSVQALIADAEKGFLGQVRENKKELGVQAGKRVIIERRFTAAMLDGYPVTSYFLREYNEFSGFLLLGGISAGLLQKLTDVCHSVFRNSLTYHRTIERAVLETVGVLEDPHQNFLSHVIFSHGSYMTYVENNLPVNQGFSDVGSEKILTLLSGALSTTKTVVLSFARLYIDKKLRGADEHRFREALAHVADLWLKEFTRIRQGLSDGFLLPRHAYIIASHPLDSLMLGSLPASGTDSYGQYRWVVVSAENFWPIEVLGSFAIGTLASMLLTYTLTHAARH